MLLFAFAALGPPILEATVVEVDELLHPVPGYTVLRKEVGGILVAEDLLQLKAFAPYRLLYPQGVSIQVPQFAETLA